jgi:hypothetical protein
VGVAKNLYVGANTNIAGTLAVTGVATFSAAPIYSSLTASSAVATDASKGLVSVTNTGTGNNVLATSPTLVTPVISSIVNTGTITLPTTTGTMALTSQVIGISQTTSDVTASRSLNTTYTNSTGKPIVAYCSISNASASALMINQIDGVTIYGSSDPTTGAYYSMTLVVPIGSTYKFNMNGTPTLQIWVETR